MQMRPMEEILTEHLIESSKILSEKYCTEHKVFDFTPGDYVKSTFRIGPDAFYKVYGIDGDKVIVSRIDDTGDFEFIKPKFLKKVELSETWIKVLYSG